MFGAIIYQAAMIAVANAKAREIQEAGWRSLPKKEFEREMRIREIRALEAAARKETVVKVKQSFFG